MKMDGIVSLLINIIYIISFDLPAKKQQLKKKLITGYHINHLETNETNAYHYSFLSPTRIQYLSPFWV